MMKFAALTIGLAVAAAGAAYAGPGPDLIQNGSFETNLYNGGATGYETVNAADDTTIANWTVTSGSVDLINTYWQAADGSFSLDMSGNGPGAIAQSFSTVAGHGYDVTFDLAGNEDGGSTIKQLLVSAGDYSDVYSFNITGHSRTSMGWTEETFFFIADSSNTTLTFASLENSPWGAALDNVVAQDIPEPATVAVFGVSLLGLGFSARRRA